MSAFPEYSKYDGMGLAELVRKNEVKPFELVEEAIGRIEKHNPTLNAVIHKMYDYARAVARVGLPTGGPFHGVPFLVKDLIGTLEGVPTSSGNRLLKSIPAAHDSELVKRWRKTGVIILGKTNTPEFGLTPYTEPETFGPTCNPWDVTRTPGGSSGGSAAAVAARFVPMATGGDGGGSLRHPASACGVFGFKPSRGRMPMGPDITEGWRGFVVEHILTRSVRDSAAMLDATHGPDVSAPYVAPPPERPYLTEIRTPPGKLRIAFTAKPMLGQNVHAECIKGLDETVTLLKELGHEMVEDAPVFNGQDFSLAFLTVLAGEIRADIEEAAKAAGKRVSVGDFDISSFGVGLFGTVLTAADYAKSVRHLQRVGRNISEFFENYDVLLTPTLSQPPVKSGSLAPSPGEKALLRTIGQMNAGWVLDLLGVIKPLAAQTYEFMPWTPPFNVTGQPAMSVPLYWDTAGLPIGMHFVGRYGDEATLFRLAAQLEQAKPWFNMAPAGYH